MKKNGKEIVIFLLVIAIVGFIVYILNNPVSTEEKPEEDKPAEYIKQGSKEVSYKGKEEISSNKTISSGDYNTNDSDTNVFLVTGGSSSMSKINLTKSGDTIDGDKSSFYGINAGILVKDSAKLSISSSDISTNGKGANGVFSNNGNINVKDTTIITTKDLSGGIMVASGGKITANNLDITTSGTSSAAIRSDRGGGTITVNNGKYTTNGVGSPAIYSTADISVSNAKLISNHSEGAIVEGKNSIALDNVELVCTNDRLNGKSTTYKNIFLYQSMSGDATNGVAEFKASNSTITTNKGDAIYVTNTEANISLENNTFNNAEGFLRIQKDSWGVDGMNGGVVNLSLSSQQAVGNIYVDSISTLNISMSNNSYYEGIINGDNTGANIELVIEKKSKIKLLGDSYITSINDANRAYTNIDFNGYKLYVNGTAIN